MDAWDNFHDTQSKEFADTGSSFPHITVYVISNVRNCGNIDISILKGQEVVP